MTAARPIEEKATAILLAHEVGPQEASRQLGIPQSTVSMWKKEHEVPSIELSPDAKRRVAESFESARDDILAQIKANASNLPMTRWQDVRDASVSLGILDDHADFKREGRHRGSNDAGTQVMIVNQMPSLTAGYEPPAIEAVDGKPSTPS